MRCSYWLKITCKINDSIPNIISTEAGCVSSHLSGLGNSWDERMERMLTFRERGEEAAALNPETTPGGHAQAVFLGLLSKNHLLQHCGDESVKKSINK